MRRSLDVSSVLSNDDLADYDIISDGPRSLESSIADLSHVDRPAADIREPPSSQAAREKFDTVVLSADDIQAYVLRAAPSTVEHFERSADGDHRTVRVYVDGVFDPFQAKDALQLRQAKLSFPSVYLLVGVFADELCVSHQTPIWAAHIDRCELLRHCRWVDEVVPLAPWTITDHFLRTERVDFVAIDEGSSINPACDKERLKGYDLVKGLRMAIPTRRTTVLTPTPMEPRSLSPFVDSAKNTIKGVSPSRSPASALAAPSDADAETPFEEPKMEEFGIGIGI